MYWYEGRTYFAFPFCPFSSFDFFNYVYVRCSMFHCAQTFECTFLLFGQSPITLCYKMGFDYVISYVIIMRNKSFLCSVAALQRCSGKGTPCKNAFLGHFLELELYAASLFHYIAATLQRCIEMTYFA